MSETTEIEKKSLEAHVELCAERYSSLDMRLDNLADQVHKVEQCVADIKEMMAAHVEKHNDRLINWGVGIISALIATTVYLFTTYVLK